MRKPDLSKLKPQPKASAAKRPDVKLPQPVEDVYRDLRDRRLLVPLVVLIVAILAVPVALSASKEDPPPPLAVATPEGAEAVSPAVLAEEEVGVRDYRERLDELKSKNPFGSGPKPADRGVGTEITAPEGEPVGSTGDAPDATPPSTLPDLGGTPPPAPAPDPDVPSGSTEPTPSGGGSSAPKKQIIVMSPRLDVVAGRSKETRQIKNLEMSDLVPAKKKAPIAMFIGVSEKLDFAHFAISENVTTTNGEGKCSPKRSDCEFLKLGVGEKQIFIYNEKRYSLRVTDIRQVVTERRTVK